jgi:hypothetical protein
MTGGRTTLSIMSLSVTLCSVFVNVNLKIFSPAFVSFKFRKFQSHNAKLMAKDEKAHIAVNNLNSNQINEIQHNDKQHIDKEDNNIRMTHGIKHC